MKSIFAITFICLISIASSLGQTQQQLIKVEHKDYDPNLIHFNGTPPFTGDRTFEYDKRGNIRLEFFQGYYFNGSTYPQEKLAKPLCSAMTFSPC